MKNEHNIYCGIGMMAAIRVEVQHNGDVIERLPALVAGDKRCNKAEKNSL